MFVVASKRWVFDPIDDLKVQELAQRAHISPVLARMLIRRNIRTEEQAQLFLNPKRSSVYDPFLMKNMDIAVDRIRKAIGANEKILVYGDYDVDGATSTAIMFLLLQDLGANVDTYIPDRFAEGYGLNVPAIEKAAANGYTVVITVDNGIAAITECKYAKSLGIDLIVTDHHQPPEELPEAFAILNPKQPGCEYPDKMLAGAGIAWKLAHALTGSFPEQYIDLSALGTIADLAPLADENRLIAHFGLEQMNQVKRPGIQALIEVSGLNEQSITAGHVGFSLGPRINASGRLDSAMHAVELLTTKNLDRARELAHFLNETNRERQEMCEEIFEDAVQQIELHQDWLKQHVLVVAAEHWNAGVIGIVASRLVERYYKPTVVLAIDGDVAKGSARSIDGFDLYKALHTCADLFDHFGGHTMAAGLSLQSLKIDEFRQRFAKIADEEWQEEWNRPKLVIDLSLSLADATMDLLTAIALMEPFGFGNPKPRFHFPSLQLDQVRAVGKENNHLQFRFSENQLQISGIAFRRGSEEPELLDTRNLDIVAELSLNEWNGKRSVQLIVSDWGEPKSLQSCESPISDAYIPVNHEVAAAFEASPQYSNNNKRNSIYDLRDHVFATGLEFCLQELVEQNLKGTILTFHKGMFLYHQPTLRAMANHFADISLVNAEGGLEPLMDHPVGVKNDSTQTLFLLDYPLSLEQYQVCLKKLGPAVIYLLQGMEAQDIVAKQCLRWLPDREHFAAVYRLLQVGHPIVKDELLMLWQEIDDPGTATKQNVSLILQVFVELGFIQETEQGYVREARVSKKQLTESETYRSRWNKVKDYQQSVETLKDAAAFLQP